jgi:hypothetical protein
MLCAILQIEPLWPDINWNHFYVLIMLDDSRVCVQFERVTRCVKATESPQRDHVLTIALLVQESAPTEARSSTGVHSLTQFVLHTFPSVLH